MNKTKKILKKYGIGGLKKNKEGQKINFRLEIKSGEMPLEENAENVFVKSINMVGVKIIEDAKLFVEGFGLESQIAPVFYPVLEMCHLRYVEIYHRFDIALESGSMLSNQWRKEGYWSKLKMVSQEEKDEIFEYVLPGYKLQSVFNEQIAKERALEKLYVQGEKITKAVREVDLLPLKKELLYESLLEAEKALELLKSGIKEE